MLCLINKTPRFLGVLMFFVELNPNRERAYYSIFSGLVQKSLRLNIGIISGYNTGN